MYKQLMVLGGDIFIEPTLTQALAFSTSMTHTLHES